MTAIAFPIGSVRSSEVKVTRERGTIVVQPESSKNTCEAAQLLSVLRGIDDMRQGRWTTLDVNSLETDDEE